MTQQTSSNLVQDRRSILDRNLKFIVLALVAATIFTLLFIAMEIGYYTSTTADRDPHFASSTSVSSPLALSGVSSRTSSQPVVGAHHSPIAVVSWSSGEKFSELGTWSRCSHIRYAKKHGYDIFPPEVGSSDSNLHSDHQLAAKQLLDYLHLIEPPAWAKVILLQKALEIYDTVIWLDADAIIMNTDLSVHQMSQQPGWEKDLVVAFDQGPGEWHFNTGVMLIRKSVWTKSFLEQTLALSKNDGHRNHGNWEQFSMIRLHDDNFAGAKSHVHIIPDSERHTFNAFLRRQEYVDGDFVIHNTGCPPDPYINQEQCNAALKPLVCSKHAVCVDGC